MARTRTKVKYVYLPRLSFDDMIKKWNKILGWDLKYTAKVEDYNAK